MKRIIITLLFVAISSAFFAQSMQIQNMINYLRNKDYEKAKASADAAAVNESTKTSSKMWVNRGRVYQTIAADTTQKVRALDPEAEEKALDAYTNCLKYDKDNIYRDEMMNDFIQTVSRVNRKAAFYRENRQYDKAIKCYELLEAAQPYNKDAFKANKLTPENLTFSKFETYMAAGERAKGKEAADKLIAGKVENPKIFTTMVRMSLESKDTTAALEYIDKGKQQFNTNIELIDQELRIYSARKKTDVLKDKLISAISTTPNNEMLHLMLGNVYKSTNQFKEAETEYLKALELKPSLDLGNYNLGVLYYNAGKEWNDKLNALPVKDPKEKEYHDKSNTYFKDAITYFEKYYTATQDKDTKKLLRQLALRLGDTEKADKYK